MTTLLKIFRHIQLITSITIFVLVFIICYKTTGFAITDIQLSHWGIVKKIGWLWNGCLVLLGISCYFNIYHYLQQHPHLNYKPLFKHLFLFQCVNISFLGFVTSGNLSHDIVAFTYFFTLPLVIFSMAALNRYRIIFNEWLVHTILSSCMMVFPLITLFLFKGMAISETLHSFFF